MLIDDQKSLLEYFKQFFYLLLFNRFQGIMHQTEWLFTYPDVKIKQESPVKLENVVPEVNGSCTPGTSSQQQSTPSKRSSTESLSKSPKKQKIENNSMDDGLENDIVVENVVANGEGSRTPVTRSKIFFELKKFQFELMVVF